VAYRLGSVATLALVRFLVDCVEVRSQADFACAHLCDHRTNSSVCVLVYFESVFSWPNSKFEELSAVLGLFPK
jgi:hypothetical protein